MGSTSMAPTGDGSCCLHIPSAVMRLRPRPPGPCCAGVGEQEVDSACLSVIRLPRLGRGRSPAGRTHQRNKIRRSSAAGYGYKRFRRDGTRRWLEDHHRSTTSARTAPVEAIAVRMAAFFAYGAGHSLLPKPLEEAWGWRRRLEAGEPGSGRPAASFPSSTWCRRRRSRRNGSSPAAQARIANPNASPASATQSLTWLGDLLPQWLIKPEDIDPFGRPPPEASRARAGACRLWHPPMPRSPQH